MTTSDHLEDRLGITPVIAQATPQITPGAMGREGIAQGAINLLVFSGAGISRESGLLTFRDGDGLWAGHPVEDVCSARAWKTAPERVLEFYNLRRREALAASPNRAHLAIAALGENSGCHVRVVTQNVDPLHECAGSSDVLHLHGEILYSRPATPSVDAKTVRYPQVSDMVMGDVDPQGRQLRPDIVFFGEEVPLYSTALAWARSTDALLVVGTSLSVYPAARIAEKTGARRIAFVDPAPPDMYRLRKLRRPGRVIRCFAKSATEGVSEAIDFLLEKTLSNP